MISQGFSTFDLGKVYYEGTCGGNPPSFSVACTNVCKIHMAENESALIPGII